MSKQLPPDGERVEKAEIVLEHRYIEAIIEGMAAEGLVGRTR